MTLRADTLTQTTTAADPSIFERISRGEFDDQLGEVFEALKQRRKAVTQRKALENAAAMKPGDEVVITGMISPKYLLGVTGKVSTTPPPKIGFVQVDIDPGQDTGRFSGKTLGVPASCLAKRQK